MLFDRKSSKLLFQKLSAKHLLSCHGDGLVTTGGYMCCQGDNKTCWLLTLKVRMEIKIFHKWIIIKMSCPFLSSALVQVFRSFEDGSDPLVDPLHPPGSSQALVPLSGHRGQCFTCSLLSLQISQPRLLHCGHHQALPRVHFSGTCENWFFKPPGGSRGKVTISHFFLLDISSY